MKKFFSVIALFIAMTISAQSAKLEYNLKKGDKYLIEMNMKQNMAPIIKMDIDISMSMEATGVKNGNFNTEYQFTRMKMDMEAQGEQVSFDSSKKDSELSEEEKKMKAEIAPVLEMIVYQTIDKSGKVLSMEMKPEVKGAGAMMNNQLVSMEYPKEAVKVGSTWDFGQNVNGMNAKAKYTVTKITNDKVYADISGSVDGVAEAKITGKLVIDRASGMFTSMNMDVSMNAMGVSTGMEVSVTSKKM